MSQEEKKLYKCPLGVFPAPAFVADFSPVAPEFHQRTRRVRLRNLGTTDKKSSHKIRYRKIPREHINIKGETDMGYQDDYVMRTISDLVRAIARLALGKNEINYALPDTEDKYSDTDRIYRKLRDLVDAGEINEAENQLYENLDENDTEHLEMALTFYMYLNQLDDDTLFMANYSREEIVEGINSVSASFGITGFENFVDTTMV